jgi:hypothetical protein
VWRHDLFGRAPLPPPILRLVQSVDVQLDGDEAHRRSCHGVLHGVRMPQVLGDVLAVDVFHALQEMLALFCAMCACGLSSFEGFCFHFHQYNLRWSRAARAPMTRLMCRRTFLLFTPHLASDTAVGFGSFRSPLPWE